MLIFYHVTCKNDLNSENLDPRDNENYDCEFFYQDCSTYKLISNVDKVVYGINF